MRCFFNPPQAQQYNSPVKGMDSRRSLFRGNGLRPGPSHLAVIGLFYRLRVVKERVLLVLLAASRCRAWPLSGANRAALERSLEKSKRDVKRILSTETKKWPG
jgi:hypothetical protein